jgi:ABC-type hemin transport system substrate-binding protein
VAPQRIDSPMPSLTEALFALGVGVSVVGRPRYRTQPSRTLGRVPKVGGTTKVDVARVPELEPDLAGSRKEENTRESIEALGEAGITVLVGAPAFFRG